MAPFYCKRSIPVWIVQSTMTTLIEIAVYRTYSRILTLTLKIYLFQDNDRPCNRNALQCAFLTGFSFKIVVEMRFLSFENNI